MVVLLQVWYDQRNQEWTRKAKDTEVHVHTVMDVGEDGQPHIWVVGEVEVGGASKCHGRCG